MRERAELLRVFAWLLRLTALGLVVGVGYWAITELPHLPRAFKESVLNGLGAATDPVFQLYFALTCWFDARSMLLRHTQPNSVTWGEIGNAVTVLAMSVPMVIPTPSPSVTIGWVALLASAIAVSWVLNDCPSPIFACRNRLSAALLAGVLLASSTFSKP